MALRNIFKKKKIEEKEVEKKEIEKPKEEIIVPKRERKLIIGEAYRILKTPHVTEKAADLVKKNQYVFNIYPKKNKIEIKKAIEDLYGVRVLKVKIINIPAKKRRLGKVKGWKAGYKKAIVKIKEGQKIEVLPR